MRISLVSLFLILIINLINNVNSSIYPIIKNNGDPEYNEASSFVYSSNSNVPHTSPGNGKSFVSFDGTITIKNNVENGSNYDGTTTTPTHYINFLVYRMSERDFIGQEPNYYMCCPADLILSGTCQLGTPYIQDSNYTIDDSNENYKLIKNSKLISTVTDDEENDGTHIYGYTIIPKQSPSKFEIHILNDFTKTGLYNIVITNCTSSLISTFSIDATVSYMNPYGYLTGNKYPFLYYNLILSACYVGLFIMWAVLFFKYKNTALRIQYWISLVILLGFIEALTNYFSLSQINKTGEYSGVSVFFVTLCGTLKSGFARALVVLVSLGYGVAIIKLPRFTVIKLGILTSIYLGFKFVQNYLYNEPIQTNNTQTSFIFLQLPVSILDTVFYWWILTALTEVMNLLEANQQPAKLKLFRSFIWSLMISALCSFIILFVEIIVTWVTSQEYATKTSWIVEVFWGISYFGVLVSICWIWKPNENNQKFAYSQLGNDDGGDDDNNVNLDTLKHRNHSNSNNNGGGNILVTDTNDNTIESIDDQENTFSIQDDEFEDPEIKEKVEIANMFENKL